MTTPEPRSLRRARALRRILFVLLACCTLATARAAFRAQPPAALATDAAVDSRGRMLAGDGLGDVEVERHGALRVLRGTVVREADRAFAETLVRAEPGVTQVVNRIEVSTRFGDRVGLALRASAQKLLRLLGAAPLLLVALAIVWAAWRSGRWAAERAWLKRRLARNPFAGSLARQAIRVAVVVLGVLVALEVMDATALATALLGSAGIAGIAIGFAFRDLLENYIAGVLLSLRQPFAADDYVAIDGREGVVVGMNSRATLLLTADGNHLTLPNATVFKAVILNFTRNARRRFDFIIALDPATDVQAAQRDAVAALRGTAGVLAEPAPFVELAGVARDELRLHCFGWVDQHAHAFGAVRSDAMRNVRARLMAGGIDFGPPVLRLLRPGEGGDGRPPREPLHTVDAPKPPPTALQQAVQRTRAEMGDADLLREGARRE